jgi:sucrose phosphorylase
VLLITETNVPHADNLSYFGDGANEAQLVYNFALPPLVLHALQTGNAETLTRWARSLAPPSERVTFFNFLASHDGIGLNPARGILSEAAIDALVAHTVAHGGFVSHKDMPDGSQAPYELNINYLDALSNPAAGEPAELVARKFLTAQAMMLCLQGVPGIYFHSLFGSRGDRASAEASGIKRRVNREKLDRARLEAELADASSLRAQIFSGYRDLLRVRAAHPAFAPAAAQRVLDLDPRVFAVLRESADGSDRMLCLHNTSATPIALHIPDGLAGGALADGVEVSPYGTVWRPFVKTARTSG